jgi:hypothetical protein
VGSPTAGAAAAAQPTNEPRPSLDRAAPAALTLVYGVHVDLVKGIKEALVDVARCDDVKRGLGGMPGGGRPGRGLEAWPLGVDSGGRQRQGGDRGTQDTHNPACQRGWGAARGGARQPLLRYPPSEPSTPRGRAPRPPTAAEQRRPRRARPAGPPRPRAPPPARGSPRAAAAARRRRRRPRPRSGRGRCYCWGPRLARGRCQCRRRQGPPRPGGAAGVGWGEPRRWQAPRRARAAVCGVPGDLDRRAAWAPGLRSLPTPSRRAYL